jgi:hypothetical protein
MVATKYNRTYKTYHSMMQRCYNPLNTSYPDYGGRGIEVCEDWQNDYDNFREDMGVRPPDKTIERINVNGDYTPYNCYWTSPKYQTRNRRNNKLNYANVELIRTSNKSAKYLAELFDVHVTTITRIRNNKRWG